MIARRKFRADFVWTAVGFCVSAAGLWFVFRHLDSRAALGAIRDMRPAPLLLTTLPLVLGTLLRAVRWNVLVNTRSIRPSLAAILVSSFFNGILPLRAGEAMRVLYFARRTGAPLAAIGTGAVLERVLDVTTLALLGATVFSTAAVRELPRLVVPSRALWVFGLLLALGLGTAAMLAGRRKEEESPGLTGRLLGDVARSLAGLASPRRAALVAILSVAMWLITAAPFVLVLRAAGTAASPRDGFVILLVVTLAIALPSTPGFVGTFHAGFVLGADAVGIPRSLSVPAAVVTHLLLQVPFILGGAAVVASGSRRFLEPEGQGAGSVRRS